VSDAPASRALVAASHGTDNSEGARAIRQLVQAVRDELGDRVAGVLDAFVDVQEPDVPAVLSTALQPGAHAPATAEHATVVPLLLSTGYHVRNDIAEACVPWGPRASIAPALGPASELISVLVQRLREAGWRADDLTVLVAAGSSDPRAVAECERVRSMLALALGVPVELGFLSAAAPAWRELVPALRAEHAGRRIIAATYLLAEGYFAGVARAAGADVVSAPLLVADAPVPPELVQLVSRRFAEAAAPEGQTGCLRGARGEPWLGCAAGCAEPCRAPERSRES
jgi:sirohydrochlorin ferrochelatase